MNKIKEMIIRKKLKYKIENKQAGIDVIRFDKGIKISKEHEKYFYLLNDIPSIVNGINKVNVMIDENIVYIYYNERYINKERIANIINELKEFIIENIDDLENIDDNNIENTVKVMKIKFKERILKI